MVQNIFLYHNELFSIHLRESVLRDKNNELKKKGNSLIFNEYTHQERSDYNLNVKKRLAKDIKLMTNVNVIKMNYMLKRL